MEALIKDEMVERHGPEVVKWLWPSHQLCAMLDKEKIIFTSDREWILQESTRRDDAAERILDCVAKRNESAWETFVQCLFIDEQKDLVRYLRGEITEDLWPTEEIIRHRAMVLRQLKYSDDLHHYLICEGVLDHADRDWFSKERTKKQKTDYVLRILETKRPSAWPKFLLCLVQDDQNELTKQIDTDFAKEIAETKRPLTRPATEKHSLGKLKFHTDQMNLEINRNNYEGIESLCHAIADQLNNSPDPPQYYDGDDISEILDKCKEEDHMQYIANRFRMNIAVLKENGAISYKHPVKESKEYTLLLGQLGHGAYVSLTEKKEAAKVKSMKAILRERYIRWFCNSTSPAFETFNQPMEMDLRKTHVEVEIHNKSKEAKKRRKDNPQVCSGRILEDALFLPHMDQMAPRTVLLEGESGVGKTTFIQRWMYEWATRTGSKFLHKVKLPIVLRAKDIKEGISKGIKDFFPKEYSDKMCSYVEVHQEHCLLIIEAFDETDIISTHECLQEYLRGNFLPRLRVLVTSRTEQAKAYEKYFDRLVVLQGLEENKVKEFIERYITCFKNLSPDCLEHELNSMFEKIPMEMLRNPLACSLLINLSIDDITPADMTLNSLYREYINCTVKRCDLDKAHGNSLLRHLQSFALWNLIKGEDFDEEVLSQFGVDMNSQCEGKKRLLKFFIQTQYYVKGNDEEKKLTFVHQQMQEYLAAQALEALKKSKQNLAAIGVLTLKCCLDCLRFIMTKTENMDDIQQTANIAFIFFHWFLVPSRQIVFETEFKSTSESCLSHEVTPCSEHRCNTLKKISSIMFKSVENLFEEICEAQTIRAFHEVFDHPPSLYSEHLEEWMNHTCEYEWSDMINEDLEFVGKHCFLAIEQIFADQPRYGAFVNNWPNIHRRILPLVKRVPTAGDNLVPMTKSLQVICSKDSSSHIEIWLHQRKVRIFNACGEDLQIALEQAFPTITGGNTKQSSDQNELSLTQQFTLTIWLNWRKPMAFDEVNKFNEGLETYMQAGLRDLRIRVQCMRYSLKLLTRIAPNMLITIQYEDTPSRHDWVTFITEVCMKRIQSLFITGENSMEDRGALIEVINSFRHKTMSINCLIIGNGTLPFSELKQALCGKKDDIIRFQDLHITDVRDTLDVKSVLSGPLVHVSLEAGPDFVGNLAPDECKQCLTLYWHKIVASTETCHLYTGILEKSKASDVVVELPCCKNVEQLENLHEKIFPLLKTKCHQWHSGCTSRVSVSEDLVESLTKHAKHHGIYYLTNVSASNGSSCIYLHSPGSDEGNHTESDVVALPIKATGGLTLITRETLGGHDGKVTCIYSLCVSDAVTAMEKIKGVSCQAIKVYFTSTKQDHLDACGAFRKIIQEMMTNGLRCLYLFVKSVISCVGLVPNDVHNLTVYIKYEEQASSEEWNMFWKDIQNKNLCCLMLHAQNAQQDRSVLMEVLEGCISEMRSVQEVRIHKGRIPITHVQKVMKKDNGNIVKYEDTCITGISSSSDLKSVLSGSITDVSLEASPDFEISVTHEECQKCLSLSWHDCIASAETCQLYVRLLKKSIQYNEIINLPFCKKAEHVMNLNETILSTMDFKSLQWPNGCTSKVTVSESLVEDLTKHAKHHGIYYLTDVSASNGSSCIYLHSPGSDEENHTESDVVALPIKATGGLTLITRETSHFQDGKAAHIYCRNVSYAVLAMKKLNEECPELQIYLTSMSLIGDEESAIFRDMVSSMICCGLRFLHIFVKRIISCVGLVPEASGELMVLICHKDNPGIGDLDMLMKDIYKKHIQVLSLVCDDSCQDRSNLVEVLGMYVSEMANIKNLVINKGMVSMNLIEKLMKKDTRNIIWYGELLITEVRNISQIKLLFSRTIINVTLKAGPGFEESLTPGECKDCLSLPWQGSVADAEKCEVYMMIKEKAGQVVTHMTHYN